MPLLPRSLYYNVKDFKVFDRNDRQNAYTPAGESDGGMQKHAFLNWRLSKWHFHAGQGNCFVRTVRRHSVEGMRRPCFIILPRGALTYSCEAQAYKLLRNFDIGRNSRGNYSEGVLDVAHKGTRAGSVLTIVACNFLQPSPSFVPSR